MAATLWLKPIAEFFAVYEKELDIFLQQNDSANETKSAQTLLDAVQLTDGQSEQFTGMVNQLAQICQAQHSTYQLEKPYSKEEWLALKAELLNLLQAYDGDALELWQANQALISQFLSRQEYQSIGNLIENFDFVKAYNELSKIN